MSHLDGSWAIRIALLQTIEYYDWRDNTNCPHKLPSAIPELLDTLGDTI